MKIQAIRIHNLASLAGTTAIDFAHEPLRSAGIFAITGPTGAGKSTILDALCLALYARTPRYRLAEHGVDITDVKGNTIKQDDVRGILRDGTASGYAEVDFEGIDGKCYRSRWSVRRAYNKEDGSLQPYEMLLTNITDGKDIPGKKTELLEETERLVGLNFEQFTRSVLLAQGDFTAFLKAGKDEKSSLLEKLTGTHVYSEISRKVFERCREEQQLLRELNLRLEGITTLTEEELATLDTEKKSLLQVIQTTEQQLNQLRKEIGWYEERIKLEEKQQSAQAKLLQAEKAQQEALPLKEKLQQVIRVQPVRTSTLGLRRTQEEITRKKEELEKVTAELHALKEEKISIDSIFLRASTSFNESIEKNEKARPLLDEARALDVQLSEKGVQIKDAETASTVASQRMKEQQTALARLEEALKTLEIETERLGCWKKEHESRRAVAEQEQLILSKLEDAGGILNKLLFYASRSEDTEKKITHCRLKNEQLEKARGDIGTSLEQQKNECEKIETQLSSVPIKAIEEKKARLDTSLEALIQADAHWKILYQAQTEQEQLHRSVAENKKLLEEQKGLLEKAGRQLQESKSARDTSLKMVERARIAAAESVERLRALLVTGEECPVCGSKSHPYTQGHAPMDHVLAELEASHKQYESTYLEKLTLCSSLKQVCTGLETNITELELKITNNEPLLHKLEQTWQALPIHDECETHPPHERAEWLQQQLLSIKQQIAQLQSVIQNHKKERETLETLQKQLTLLERQSVVLENEYKDNMRALQSLEELQKNDRREQQAINLQLNDVRSTLGGYFPGEKWFDNWQANPDAFVAHIRDFAQAWKKHTTLLDELTHQHEREAEKAKSIQAQLKIMGEEVDTKKAQLAALHSVQQTLMDKRSMLFKGRPIEEVEKALKEAIDLAGETLELQRKKREAMQTHITRNMARHEQLEKDIAALSQQESLLQLQLKEWIAQHNRQFDSLLTDADLHALLTYSEEWIETERASLKIIDDTVLEARSIVDEHNKALGAHLSQRLTEQPVEVLSGLLDETSTTLKNHAVRANEIDFKIKDDKLKKLHIGKLWEDVNKQAAVVDNWAKLNEVIGSADGKKFRQIAQEYTLDMLLGYANVHLEMLSKRYLLQRIPHSLGLQVIDRDMGDEVRTVYSLSGGESFLVSLALALGLASLSSSRMKVESLFIDEGFGSLDPTTLNIAMDALERLHHQGRKVGVISHVQEMTERIPVQIKVSKQQSGKSRVEVIGF